VSYYFVPFSDFLLSNHLLNLKISTPAEMVMREIARKLGWTIDWSSPGAVDWYEHLSSLPQFFMTGNASKATMNTTISATPADDTIAPDLARVSNDNVDAPIFAQSA
jgi:hypothetical protein